MTRIHTAGAIPSSLHQKVKFISGNKLIIVTTEEDTSVPTTVVVPFINTQQLDSASKYHSFEFVSVNYIPEGGAFLEPKLSKTKLMVGRYLIRRQYEPRTDLGKHRDGILEPNLIKSQDSIFGLGFKPTRRTSWR